MSDCHHFVDQAQSSVIKSAGSSRCSRPFCSSSSEKPRSAAVRVGWGHVGWGGVTQGAVDGRPHHGARRAHVYRLALVRHVLPRRMRRGAYADVWVLTGRECAGLRRVATQDVRQRLSVVGVNVGVVATARDGDRREAVVDELLPGACTIEVHEDAIRRLPLAAVARHGIPVIHVGVAALTCTAAVQSERDGPPAIRGHLTPHTSAMLAGALGWRLALRLPIPANLAAIYDEARKVA